MEVLPEQSDWKNVGQVLAVWVVPWLAYYLGIFIRKRVFPGPNSPSLVDQFLLGIPICLLVVSPLVYIIITLKDAILSSTDGVPAYLFIIGAIMTEGMVLHETATKLINMHSDQVHSSG